MQLRRKTTEGVAFLADNDFAGFRVERVLLDTGCGTHLLPLPDANSLAQLRQTFPAPCIWGLAQSAGTFCVLTIFHLCADDLKAVTALKVLELDAQLAAEKQLQTLLPDQYPTSRRKHAIVGQDFIHGDAAFVQHKNVAVLVDKTFEMSWPHLERFHRFVRYHTELLPNGFENLEELHIGDSNDHGEVSEVECVVIG